MRMYRSTSAFVLVLFFLSLDFLNTGSALRTQAQQRDDLTSQDTARAIEIYRQGNATEAIKQLEDIVKKRPDDADAWYYLGLAFNSQGFIGNSRPAFEQFIRLRPTPPTLMRNWRSH